MKTSYTSIPYGLQNNLWCSDTAGIPATNHIWKAKHASNGLMASSISDGESLYVMSVGDLLKVNPENGELVFAKLYCDEKGSTSDTLCISSDYILGGWYVFDAPSGEELIDIRALLQKEAHEIGRYNAAIPIEDGFLVTYGDSSTTQKIHKVNVKDKSICVLQDTLSANLYSSDDIQYMYTWGEGALARVSLDSPEYLFKVALPLEYGVCVAINDDKVVYNYDIASLCCIDGNTGRTIWDVKDKVHTEHQNKPNYNSFKGRYLGLTDDRAYICNNGERGWIKSFDMADGACLWSIEVEGLSRYCISGDIIFGSEKGYIPVAWDRYSGEKIWEADVGLEALYHIVTLGNKVIYSSTSGVMLCYEWVKEYQSPAKI